jgi:hypothetical protein
VVDVARAREFALGVAYKELGIETKRPRSARKR